MAGFSMGDMPMPMPKKGATKKKGKKATPKEMAALLAAAKKKG